MAEGPGSSMQWLPGGIAVKVGQDLGLLSGTLRGAETDKRKRKSLTKPERDQERPWW